MSDIRVNYDGDTYWLQCFADDPNADKGDIVSQVDAGDSWGILAENVAEHQAQHGCAPKDEPAKVIVVTDDAGRQHRYAAPNFGMLHDGTLVIGDKVNGDDLRVDAARAPGRWAAVHKDSVLAPDVTAIALGIARRALEQIANTVLEADDPRREVVRIARDALEEIFAETEL